MARRVLSANDMTPSRKKLDPDPHASLREAQTARDVERERADTATALFLAVARLHIAQDREDVFAALEEIALGILEGAQVAVYLREDGTDRLDLVYASGPRARAAARTFPPSDGIASRAASGRRLVVEHLPSGACDAAVALGSDGGGALVLHGLRPEGGALPEALLQQISVVGHHAAIALWRAP
jgi:hypothetical protein